MQSVVFTPVSQLNSFLFFMQKNLQLQSMQKPLVKTQFTQTENFQLCKTTQTKNDSGVLWGYFST